MERTTENYISLYNTVGLIERDKNIYFVPHQADIYAKRTAQRTKVCDCYIELFNTVLSFSSRYHDIKISQWTPEDRSLVIEGTIDDFRQSRGRGLALNYLIVKRTVSDEESGDVTTNHYYFAYFIDSVEQRGNNSVRLSLTPDHFTNLYYLNNEDTLTSNYDPFNPIMKNCFVERQHYDRFEKVNNILRYKNLKRILSSEQSFNFKYQYKDKYNLLPLGFDISCDRLEKIYYELKEIDSKESFNIYMTQLSNNERKLVVSIFTSYLNIILKENILFPVTLVDETLSGETALSYYAGACKYNDIYSPLTHIVIPFISIPRDFSNISKDWLTMNITLAYKRGRLAIGKLPYKSSTEVLTYLYSIGASQYVLTNFVSKYSPIFNNVSDISVADNQCYINYLVYMEQDNAKYKAIPRGDYIELSQNSFGFLPATRLVGGKEVIATGERFFGEVTSPASEIVHDSLFYYSNNALRDNTSNLKFVTRDIVPNSQGGSDVVAYYRDTTDYDKFFVFVLGDNMFMSQTISISDKLDIVNLNRDYIDPLLESDPYSFYSLSIYETEQIVSKMRLFESYANNEFTFKVEPIISYNESYKVGLLLSYKYDNEYRRYYTESIVLSIASQIPMIDDSWLTYYVQNKAQMKNQYAVQQNNYESSKYQARVSAGADTLGGALSGLAKYGTMGAVAGGVQSLIKSGANLINIETQNKYAIENITLTQKAKMADMGAKPDTVKLAGSDVLYDAIQNDRGFHINHYTIDEVSYNSACKYLERYGYLVNIFDSLNVFDRYGLNYIQISSFDFVEDNFVLSEEQMNAVSSIFAEGVTLLHNKDFLHNLGETGYHNIETALRR